MALDGASVKDELCTFFQSQCLRLMASCTIRACLIYTFFLSFSSSFTFQTGKFTSSYICNSNDKWNDISNDWMLSVPMPFAVSQKR